MLIPVHLIAFALLYFGLVRLMRAETLRTNSAEARALLTEAVGSLHPLMCSKGDHGVIPLSVGQFAERHSLLDFQIFRADGSLLGQPGKPIPRIRDFLDSDAEEFFHYSNRGDVLALQGILRVRADGKCTECHDPGAQLGAATMDMDLTPEVSFAQDRLEHNLLLLVISWALMVGVVNIGIGAWARRSLAHVRRMEEMGASGTVSTTPLPGVFLDPVAAELYRSLAQVFRRQQEEKEVVSDRLHHTERLASLGQLAAGLAHEIKNPLAGIRGVMELLRDDAEEDQQKELFIQVVDELDRVNEIIHRLLNFARPALPKREEIGVEEMLEEAVQFLCPAFVKKGISLNIEVASDVGSFFLDPSQMRHIVTNLVANAADAIESDGWIVVRASLYPEGGGLIISVEDSAPGIPEESLAQIFEPFFTTKFSGTGLGLAVVRSLVTQHRGRIEVESEVGRGTTFFILLPDRPVADSTEETAVNDSEEI